MFSSTLPNPLEPVKTPELMKTVSDVLNVLLTRGDLIVIVFYYSAFLSIYLCMDLFLNVISFPESLMNKTRHLKGLMLELECLQMAIFRDPSVNSFNTL